jgi:hypothetical protein
MRSEHDLKLTQNLLGHLDIRSTAKYAQLDTPTSPPRSRQRPKCSRRKSRLAGKMEAAGIEPA